MVDKVQEIEFESEHDAAGIVDAGIRPDSMVRQMSVQEAMLAQVDEGSPPKSFQQAIEAQYEPQELAWQRGTGSDDNDRYAGAVLGSASAIATGNDVYDAIDKGIDDISNSVDAGAQIYSTVANTTDEAVRRQLDTLSGVKDSAVYTGVFEELKRWKLDNTMPWGFEAFTEDQLGGYTALKSKEGSKLAQERIFLRYGESLVANQWAKYSKLDTAIDFTKLWFLPGTTIAMGSFTEKFDPKLFGKTVNTLDEVVGKITDLSVDGKGFKAYKQTVDQFWKLPVEKRFLSLMAIDKHIQDIAGANGFVYMSMMYPFVSHEEVESVEFDYLMDNLTIASFIPGRQIWKVAKFAGKVRNSRKPIQILKDTGNVAEAARVLNKALVDVPARSVKVTGMHKAELAMAANPVDATVIMPEQMQGVAKEAAEQLGKEILNSVGRIDQEYANMADPSLTPRRFYFDETAKVARQQEVLDQVSGNATYPTFAKIGSRTDDGFTLEVEYGSKYSGKYDVDSLRAANAQHEQAIADLHERAGELRSQMRDEAFGVDDEVKKIQKQLSATKAIIRKNERIIKDLEKEPTLKTIPVKYTFKETGKLDVEELQRGTFPHLASPSQVVDQLYKQVGSATLAEFQESKILGNLHGAIRDVIRGSTNKQRENVDKILLWGDELGKTFRLDELIDGVATKWGLIKLDSTKDISMYYGIRRAFDNIHRIKNDIQTRELEVAGFKQMTSKILNSRGEPVKLFAKQATDDVTGATGSKKIPDNVKRIYDHQAGDIVHVTDELKKKLKGEWEVVRFRHGYRFGDEVINYGIVRPNKDFKPIAGRVLDYNPGYVPKQRPGVFYTATRKTEMLVDGVKSPRFQTERFFRTEGEAYEWWARQSAEDRAAISILPDKRYKHSAYETHDEEFDALNFGGLYSGERTDRTILMGLDGEDAHRTSSYKALSLYMGHIANRYSSNELKMGLIGRFQNTYGEYLQNPANWKSPLKVQYHNDLSLNRAVNAQRDYIKDLIRLPDPMQDWWNQKMRNIAELMEGSSLGGKPRDWVMDLGARDPTAALRAATFHLYLGFFNFSQMLVQGMGTATAMAAYPLKAGKLLPKNLALRAAWGLRDNKQAMVQLFDGFGMNGDEMSDIVREIERVGLFDSLKTSADYNAGINGISVTGDAARRVLESGLMPFREGEQFARGYGYLLARDLFMQGRPKHYKPTDKDVDRIAKDSLRFTLNLNRSNKAFWQNGILSIPTQFFQVTAKFYENMIAGSFGYGNRVWTNGEKVKIMLGHMAMFGLAGAPFMDTVTTNFVNMHREATDDTKAMTTDKLNPFNGVAGLDDETVARMVRGGLVQAMAYVWTGSDPELTTRFSIPSGIEESLDMYTHGDKTLASAFVGAMGPGLGRGFDALVGLHNIFNPAYSENLTDQEIKMAMREVASVLSSTRNADKAYWWYKMQSITNSKGQRIMELEDDEFNATLLWQALGFAPAKVGWMYDLQESTSSLNSRIEDRTKAINDLLDKYTVDETLLNSENKQKNLNKVITLLLEDTTARERKKIVEGVKRHLSEEDYKVVKVIADSIKAQADAGGLATSGTLANPLLVPKEETR